MSCGKIARTVEKGLEMQLRDCSEMKVSFRKAEHVSRSPASLRSSGAGSPGVRPLVSGGNLHLHFQADAKISTQFLQTELSFHTVPHVVFLLWS